MMALLLGNSTHFIDESQSRLEIGKFESADEMMLINNLPSRGIGQLLMDLVQFFPLERRDTAAARDASLVS